MTKYDCIFGAGCKMAECVKYHPKEERVDIRLEYKKYFHLGGVEKGKNVVD